MSEDSVSKYKPFFQSNFPLQRQEGGEGNANVLEKRTVCNER